MYALLLRLLPELFKALLLAGGVFWLALVTLHLVPPLGRLVRRFGR